MKNFHQNLLLGLAMCLCALCLYQWNAQTQQYKQMTTLNQLLYDQTAALQESTNRVGNLDKQIAQMDARLTELKETVKTNEAVQLDQRREISRLRIDNESLTNQVGQYKEAVDKFEIKLKEAYEGIKKQNEALKQLTAQRDEFIQKLNGSVKERNDVVGKYNDLVKSLEKQPSK